MPSSSRGRRSVAPAANDFSQLELASRQQARLHVRINRVMRTITESSFFNGFIMFVIFVNAIALAMETETSFATPEWRTCFLVLDYMFLLIYSLEFIMKIIAEPIDYWHSGYNLFDFLILVTSLANSILSWSNLGENDDLEALRVLRALRTLRTLRTVSFIKGLQVLVIALIDTIRKWVINILGLLLLLMFLFAIMGYYFFGYPDMGDKENWGNLGAAMLTLFSYVTVDGWTDLQDSLDRHNVGSAARVYSIIFIFLGHFIFTNVFIGVIIMNISEATEAHKLEQRAEKEGILRHKKEFMLMRQHNEVKLLLERQKRGKYSNFNEMVQEFQRGLRHEDLILLSDLCTNMVWVETFTHTLDIMDSTVCRLQQYHFEMANLLARHMDRKLKKKYGL